MKTIIGRMFFFQEFLSALRQKKRWRDFAVKESRSIKYINAQVFFDTGKAIQLIAIVYSPQAKADI